MHDIDGAPLQLVFQNDGDTPMEFVAGLLRNVFGKPERDATALTQLTDRVKLLAAPIRPALRLRCSPRRKSVSVIPDIA